jgi:Bacterial protein of unknown function (DUF899)
MTNTPDNFSRKPPVVDQETWQAARDELMTREKAHMREGDAIAAARRRLPMMEIDATVEVTGTDGPVPFIDLFQGRDVLLVHKHMWHDGIPIEGQCMGCTINTWHIQRSAVYLNARGVSFAVLTEGPWEEVARFVEFMGYTEPWYSVRGLAWPVGDDMGPVACFLRDGDKVFLTYATVSRVRVARHDAVRSWRGVGGHPGRMVRGSRFVLVLAHRRRRRRDVGSDQSACGAVDPSRRDPGRRRPRPRLLRPAC